MRKIYEYCPHCENEVELNNSFEVQICPECGRPIFPCSLCATCLGWNADCPLMADEIRMNRELGFDD